MLSLYKVVTDGKVFRILKYGRNVTTDRHVSNWESGEPLEFGSKEEAEAHIHRYLSHQGWKDA